MLLIIYAAPGLSFAHDRYLRFRYIFIFFLAYTSMIFFLQTASFFPGSIIHVANSDCSASIIKVLGLYQAVS